MATTDSRFSAADFRESIRFAMIMGTPPLTADRAVFVFATGGKSYWKNGVELGVTPRLDLDGKPLDPMVEVRTEAAVTKKQGPGADEIACAIEMEMIDREELPVGNLAPSRMTVTVLDVDWVKLDGVREVIMGGDRYVSPKIPPALGLFDAGIQQIYFYAVDEN